MKPYTFTVIQYHHDAVTGERVNVGIVLYCDDPPFLGARCSQTYSRLSDFFGRIPGDHFRKMMDHIEAGIYAYNLSHIQQSQMALDPEPPPSDAAGWLSKILPRDDSALQYTPVIGGLTDDPEATLEALFDRYVRRYSLLPKPQSRTNDQVATVYTDKLRKAGIYSRLLPKKVAGKNYEHEFPLTWKNGIRHAAEAISFDLVDGRRITEKAVAWLGRGTGLMHGPETVKLHLLLGAPSNENLHQQYAKAIDILRQMPIDHALYEEGEAGDFADFVKKDLADGAA